MRPGDMLTDMRSDVPCHATRGLARYYARGSSEGESPTRRRW